MKSGKIKLLLIVGLLGFSALGLNTVTLAANDFEQAQKAVQAGNFAEAYYLMRILAEDDDAEAAYFLGWMYHEGLGLVASDQEAIRWWAPAAEEGHIESLMALGLLYQLGGQQVRRNTAKAVDYYLQAAEEGEEDARLNIVALLLRGDMPAMRKIRSTTLRQEPEVLGEMAEVEIAYASAREQPRHSAAAVATIMQGTELVKLAQEGEWYFVGLPARRKFAWIHASALHSGDD